MNNQISNPKTEVPMGISLNDKVYITSLLACLKEMTKNYALVMTEASNQQLFNIYKTSFEQIISLQREVYELMFRKGWYSLEKVDENKITNKYQTLNQEVNSL